MGARKLSFRLLLVLVYAVGILLVLGACARGTSTPYPTYTLPPTYTPYPTYTPEPTPPFTPEPTAGPTLAPTATPIPLPTATPCPCPTPTPSPTPTVEPTPTQPTYSAGGTVTPIPPPTPVLVTLEEYILNYFCADWSEVVYYWRDLVEKTAPKNRLMRSIRPPDDLLAYHEAAIASIEAMVEVARRQDPEGGISAGILRESPRYVAAHDDYVEEREALPEELRDALYKCQVPSEVGEEKSSE